MLYVIFASAVAAWAITHEKVFAKLRLFFSKRQHTNILSKFLYSVTHCDFCCAFWTTLVFYSLNYGHTKSIAVGLTEMFTCWAGAALCCTVYKITRQLLKGIMLKNSKLEPIYNPKYTPLEDRFFG